MSWALLLCGQGLVYACRAWRLWFGSRSGCCSACAVTGKGPVPGRRCRPSLCGCTLPFGYTLCGPGSGYAGVLRYLRFGLWRCSRYVVMGFDLVHVPVGVVSLRPLIVSPLRGPVVPAVPGSKFVWSWVVSSWCLLCTAWVGPGGGVPGACFRLPGPRRPSGPAGRCVPPWVVVDGVLGVAGFPRASPRA